MVIEDGRYVEMTEEELMTLYLEQGWDDCYSFIEYELGMENSGCKILEKKYLTNG